MRASRFCFGFVFCFSRTPPHSLGRLARAPQYTYEIVPPACGHDAHGSQTRYPPLCRATHQPHAILTQIAFVISHVSCTVCIKLGAQALFKEVPLSDDTLPHLFTSRPVIKVFPQLAPAFFMFRRIVWIRLMPVNSAKFVALFANNHKPSAS